MSYYEALHLYNITQHTVTKATKNYYSIWKPLCNIISSLTDMNAIT